MDERRPDGRHARVPLTRAELDILTASAAGMGTAEVAASLGLATDVVRAHVASAAATLGARSKLEAVILASRAGLIHLE